MVALGIVLVGGGGEGGHGGSNFSVGEPTKNGNKGFDGG